MSLLDYSAEEHAKLLATASANAYNVTILLPDLASLKRHIRMWRAGFDWVMGARRIKADQGAGSAPDLRRTFATPLQIAGRDQLRTPNEFVLI